MDRKHRTLFIMLIAVVVVVAVFSAFALNLFRDTPAVILPTLPPEVTRQPDPGGDALGDYTKVVLTTETVQQVIATLTRPTSYARTVTIETQGKGDAFGTATAHVMADGNWVRVNTTLPDDRTEHTLVGEGYRYLWYGSETTQKRYSADDHAVDLAQRLPTYEDILAADPQTITSADYVDREGLSCIFVEVKEPTLGYRQRYWVSVDTGLLVAAESLKWGVVFYRMSGYTIETPATPGTQFVLADGTLLHTIAS